MRRSEICSKPTIKRPERLQWRQSGVFIGNFEMFFFGVASWQHCLEIAANQYLTASLFFSAIKNKLKLEHKFFSLFQENVRGEIIENLH